MPDLGVVKSNVSKMVSMGAPESDIDSYIQAEGTNVDAIRNFQVQPAQQTRFNLKSEQPYDSYSYIDAIKDTGKTVVNSLANVGDSVIQPVMHPIKTAGNIISGLGNAIVHPVDTAKNIGDSITSTNNPDNVPNFAYRMHTDPFSVAGDIVGAGAIAKSLPALAKGVGNGASNVGKFFDFDQKGLSLVNKVRSVASQSKQMATDKFGLSQEMLQKADPNAVVPFHDVVDGIKQNFTDMAPEAKAVFRKTPILKDMLKEPNEAGYISPDSISLQQSQEIINYINTKIPKNIRFNNLDVLDAQNDIRAAQLQAFKGMEGVRSEYAQYAKDYNLVKSALRPKSTINAIKSNFDNNIEVKDAAKRIFTPEVLKEMSKYRTQVGVANFAKRLVSLGVLKEGGWKLLQK